MIYILYTFKNTSLILFSLSLFFMLESQDNVTLNEGNSITKEISLGEEQHFTVDLKKGEFAILNVQQKGIDVKIVVRNSKNEFIDEFDSPTGVNGKELVVVDGKESDTYSIIVSPLGQSKKVIQGVYTIDYHKKNFSAKDQLNEILKIQYDAGYIPGYAVGVNSADKNLFEESYGYAILEDKTPYTTSTVQNVASISKTLIGVSLMMLVEEGKINLDMDINDLLPFKIVNPHYPNSPITIRHLATHTASINEYDLLDKIGYQLTNPSEVQIKTYPKSIRKTIKCMAASEDMPLGEFLQNILCKGGKYYKKKNYFKRPSGTDEYYSNTGSALAAYIVEVVSGISYDEFTQERIFKPLELNSAAWSVLNTDKTHPVRNYTVDKILIPEYRTITYPDGDLWINIQDLNKYLMTLMRGYYGEDNIISAASYQEIMSPLFKKENDSSNGLFWEISKSGNYGHNGGDTGIIAMMYFHPENKRGYTLLMNTLPVESYLAESNFSIIWKAIKRYSVYMD